MKVSSYKSNTLKMDKWGYKVKIFANNSKYAPILDKDVYINNGEEKIRAGKYSVIASFFANHKPVKDIDKLCIRMTPFYEYEEDGEMERVYWPYSTYGPYTLQYPYEVDIKLTGNEEYIELN